MTTTLPEQVRTRRAVGAVFLVFGANGFVFASWVSRIPAVRDRLDLTPGRLGLLLLALSAGSVLSVPLAGFVVSHLGPRRSVATSALALGAGLAVVSLGFLAGPAPVAVGLFVMGLGYGTCDVAMNVGGAQAEQAAGRSIMPRFHAVFSVGTVAGALIGTGMVALGVPVTAHLLVVAALVTGAIVWGARMFLEAEEPEPGSGAVSSRVLAAWVEPRTLLIGVVVLAAAFAEGTGNDWLGVGIIDGYGTSASVGSLSFALFVAAMTVGRWFGPTLLDRHGRVLMLRASAGLALVGLLLVSYGQVLAVAVVGIVAWGLGAALGFPVGMSAAADDPAHAAARVSVTSSVGYTAFIAGPPLIGLLGDHVGVLHALPVASALLAVGLLASGAARPLAAPSRP